MQKGQRFWTSATFGIMALAVALILGLAWLSVYSGAALSFSDAAEPAALIIAAFVVGRGLRQGNSSGKGGAAVGVLLLAAAGVGCGAPCVG